VEVEKLEAQAIEQRLSRRFSCATIGGGKPRCAPVACPPSSSCATSPFSRRCAGFVERRENVIFLGPPGVGKTHLAISRLWTGVDKSIVVNYLSA
jgi:hypothetical protein